MDIILLERIEKLGQMGDVVTVKNGYARNFLLPQNKALRATEDNRHLFEQRRGELETRNLERRQEAEAVGAKLDGQSCTVLRQAGENGQLYGSVTNRDIVDELTATGFLVERRQVMLERPIKTLGVFEVKIALHPEVAATVRISVARSREEAERQISLHDGQSEQVVAAEAFFESKELAEEAVAELVEDEAERQSADGDASETTP